MLKRDTLQVGPLRSVKSFTTRGGRGSAVQKQILDELWPKFGLQLSDQELNLEQTFGRAAPIILEIGFGDGRSFLSNAQHRLDCNFIGVEVYSKGIANVLTKTKQYNLSNIRIFCADAFEVLQNCIPDGSLHKVQLFFPDPWPKARHHKRRIVQQEFVQLVARKLAIGGTLHMATDWADYAKHMATIMQQQPGWQEIQPDPRPVTKFEQRGLRLGHGTWDLMFRKCRNI